MAKPPRECSIAAEPTKSQLPPNIPHDTEFDTTQPTISERDATGSIPDVSGLSPSVPTIPSIVECESEFRMQFYLNLEKRMIDSQKNNPQFRIKGEAMAIIKILSEWDDASTGK